VHALHALAPGAKAEVAAAAVDVTDRSRVFYPAGGDTLPLVRDVLLAAGVTPEDYPAAAAAWAAGLAAARTQPLPPGVPPRAGHDPKDVLNLLCPPVLAAALPAGTVDTVGPSEARAAALPGVAPLPADADAWWWHAHVSGVASEWVHAAEQAAVSAPGDVAAGAAPGASAHARVAVPRAAEWLQALEREHHALEAAAAAAAASAAAAAAHAMPAAASAAAGPAMPATPPAVNEPAGGGTIAAGTIGDRLLHSLSAAPAGAAGVPLPGSARGAAVGAQGSGAPSAAPVGGTAAAPTGAKKDPQAFFQGLLNRPPGARGGAAPPAGGAKVPGEPAK
jgi:hypothetical protein